jgi:hypothetical protein
MALVIGLATVGAARAEEASAPELVAARELFRQGTEEVDAGRYTQALEKFRRVAAVKETANVRFNIARCEESLGMTGTALADFELAEREGKGDDVATLAHERADAIRPRVPRLRVTAPTPLPEGFAVMLDGAKLAIAALDAPLPVDPGAHAVEASAPGRAPFHASVTLIAGESRDVLIAMGKGAAATPAATAATPAPTEAPSPPPSAPSSRHTWGAVALGAGGALAAGSVAFLLLHNTAVSSVESDCPGNHCPASSHASVTGEQSHARTDEALSIGFAAAAAVGVGVGVYLVIGGSADAPRTAWLAPGAAGTPAGVTLGGRF